MRAAVFQCDAGGLDSNQRLRRLDAAIAGQKLDLVVCPELFMSGYDIGDAIVESAEAFDGPFANAIGEIAKKYATAIIYGYPERVDDGIYNAALCIDSSGEIIANHRKLLLPPGFEPHYFKPGPNISLFEIHGLRCAMLVCYDVEYPESVRAVAEAGAEMVIVPTALGENWGVVAEKLVPTRAFENGVWLVYANHAGKENNTAYFGGSCIVAPDGKDAARAGSKEMLISVEVDHETVSRAQARLPYLKEVAGLRGKLGD